MPLARDRGQARHGSLAISRDVEESDQTVRSGQEGPGRGWRPQERGGCQVCFGRGTDEVVCAGGIGGGGREDVG